MSSIKTIQFNHLRNEAHYEFLVVFLNLLDKFPVVKAVVQMFLPQFLELFNLLKKLVDAAGKSLYTLKLVEADKRIDRCVAGIKAAILSALHHFDPRVVDAARTLNDRVKDFGKIRSKAYEEESAAVQLLIGDLRGKYATQVTTVGLDVWVSELVTAEAEFSHLFELRNTERSLLPQERTKDVLHEIEQIYRKMVALIETNLVVNGASICGEFVKQLNTEITYFNEHTHRHAPKDIAGTTVEPIGTQPFSGEPVLVIPVVWYAEEGKPARKLVFSVDFTLTYRNNVKVGNAELIIHGKGAFKGTKTVTFNIENGELRIENGE
jgi:hypothetical protein